MREIDYNSIIKNYDDMINTLEYDSMRSAGKAKLNAETLLNLHALREKYSAKKQPIKKEA